MDDLRPDIIERIRQDFGPDQTDAICARLQSLRSQDPALYIDRIIRCILFLAAGDRAKFDDVQHLAEVDYRDLIVAAEYKDFDTCLRDFNKPFGEENLDTKA